MVEFFELRGNDILFLSELLNERQIVASLHNAVMNYREWLDVYNNNWKNDKYERHFIIYSDKEPAGWLKLNGFDNPETAWISMLVISTKEQGKGIGKSAIDFSEEYIKNKGYKKIGIHTTDDNIIAHKLYTRCGYTITEHGECTTGDGVQRMGYTFMKII